MEITRSGLRAPVEDAARGVARVVLVQFPITQKFVWLIHSTAIKAVMASA